MAATKNTAKDDPKVSEKEKNTPKSSAKDAPKVVTSEAPQSSRKAVSQDAPEESKRSAVNDANPAATTNRFSGLHPNNSYPLVSGKLDEVQEQKKQARDESARTRRVSNDATPRVAHPALASKYKTNDHATRTAEATV